MLADLTAEVFLVPKRRVRTLEKYAEFTKTAMAFGVVDPEEIYERSFLAGPLPGIRQDRQILMPFISQQEGYILSPYMDYLSFFFNKKWRLPMGDMVSMMIKLADEEKGSVNGKHIDKTMTQIDDAHMEKAILQTIEILERLGIPKVQQFAGTLNAGHPGGMLPLTAAEKDSLHSGRLPENLYVADATILPKAMGNPPILTIMALAKKIAYALRRNAL